MSHQVLMELRADASSLALDWVHKNLFWALPNSIVMSNLDGSNREEILKTDHPALDLTVDPYDRYCTNRKSIHKSTSPRVYNKMATAKIVSNVSEGTS